MKLIFATNNNHKIEEIRSVIDETLQIITLKEAGIDIEIPEPFDTLEENASAKSKTIFEITGTNCFSEDTGLEVRTLQNAPGVKSARYAGIEKSPEKNIDKLLKELGDKQDRKARFRTVISLIISGKETLFEGICEGRITKERKGAAGFGYDPVFIPDGANKTFAEMDTIEKNKLSHRFKATQKLVVFLNSLATNH